MESGNTIDLDLKFGFLISASSTSRIELIANDVVVASAADFS